MVLFNNLYLLVLLVFIITRQQVRKRCDRSYTGYNSGYNRCFISAVNRVLLLLTTAAHLHYGNGKNLVSLRRI